MLITLQMQHFPATQALPQSPALYACSDRGPDNPAATHRPAMNCEPQELEFGCTKHRESLYLYLPITGSMLGYVEASVAPATDLVGSIEDTEDFAQTRSEVAPSRQNLVKRKTGSCPCSAVRDGLGRKF